MEKIKKLLSKKWIGYTAAGCICVTLYVALEHLSSVLKGFAFVWNMLLPITVGIIIAYLFNPVATFFEKKLFKKIKNAQSRHFWGAVMAAVCLILVIALLLTALVPSLASSVKKLIANWTSYTAKAENLIEKASAFASAHNINIDMTNVRNMIENSMDNILATVKENYKNILSKLGEIGTGLSNFALGLVFGFCFLAAKDTLLGILRKIRRALFKSDTLERHDKLFARCNDVFIRYIGRTLLDALIIGIATLVFTLATGMPYAPLIAAVCGVTNIIPTFGPMIGAAIGVFFIILESPVKALIFLVFICILQGIDGAVIKPKLYSGSLGIPAIWTLVLIIFGGKVAGILGILLAVPFGAVFVIIYNETIEPRLEKRAKDINKDKPADTQSKTE
jgi:predicted PurR-regulated permease PerM